MSGRRPATRAEVCALAVAECFRGDGEILANPIGTIPMIGGRLARATFEPDLLMTDGEAALVANDEAFAFPGGRLVETSNSYRSMFFNFVWTGRRHVVMSGSQIDRYGNHNFAAVGAEWARPKVALLGFRGAPGNTIQNTTSYWIPSHTKQVFVEEVDFVTGVGWDRALALPPASRRYFEVRRVVSNLGVLDFGGPGHSMRLLSVHPGVAVADVVAATGFELALADEVAVTRQPDEHELELIRTVIDPAGAGEREVPS
ncbi:MAG TPA: CoA-transferase [Acidimicrobiales bacterium]|jgi:acyl CoA:acetate/3-ketoacid CoA transferase beta subunit|nr:CoA-transferase [Acidimicrobiales bacterium]